MRFVLLFMMIVDLRVVFIVLIGMGNCGMCGIYDLVLLAFGLSIEAIGGIPSVLLEIVFSCGIVVDLCGKEYLPSRWDIQSGLNLIGAYLFAPPRKSFSWEFWMGGTILFFFLEGVWTSFWNFFLGCGGVRLCFWRGNTRD